MSILVNRTEHDELAKRQRPPGPSADEPRSEVGKRFGVEIGKAAYEGLGRKDLVPPEGRPTRSPRVEDVRAARRNRFPKPGTLGTVKQVARVTRTVK